jgi:hypothetical protein
MIDQSCALPSLKPGLVSCLDGTAAMTRWPILWVCAYDVYQTVELLRCTMHYHIYIRCPVVHIKPRHHIGRQACFYFVLPFFLGGGFANKVKKVWPIFKNKKPCKESITFNMFLSPVCFIISF